MAKTADQSVSDLLGQSVDGRIFILTQEREKFLPVAAAARVAEIDAELAVLASEKARFDPRRSDKKE